MTDEKQPLTGKAERLMRTVERTLAARARREQPGVKITNLASGVRQVEVHAYDDDLSVAGERARAEFERQTGLVGVPEAEYERLKWLASIGQVALDRGIVAREEVPTEPGPEPMDLGDLNEMDAKHPGWDEQPTPEYRDIQAGPGRRRKSVPATGGNGEKPTADEMDVMIEKLRQVADSGVEGVEVSDADA